MMSRIMPRTATTPANLALQLPSFVGRPSAPFWRSQLNAGTLGRRENRMIGKSEMMQPLLQACPSFQSEWDAFLDDWSEETEKPLYLALDQLARHLISMLLANDVSSLTRVFEVVERWHVEGDEFVREAATVGLLEDLQNTNLHTSTCPADFERFLLPESLKWWAKVDRFWSTGQIIADD